MSVAAATVAAMSNAAQWATSAANKFRKVARDTESATTKELAEGLAHLAEAIREMDAKWSCTAVVMANPLVSRPRSRGTNSIWHVSGTCPSPRLANRL
ncbi:hypothetical protein EAH80_04355 [Mycobacterium hodleri]|uniref:Uncharacterized protein n=1 Tax=Mycolicibacterium hodleri TaxID=49897 RepID=A0A502EHZ2_9MYCO|nr:hypothetical protein EAH80_04355 [Mycolicibacterium hodleri]